MYFPQVEKLELPEENYKNHTGNGTYKSGVIFNNVYHVKETGSHLVQKLSEEELNALTIKTEQEIEEIEEKRKKQEELEKAGFISSIKQKIETEGINNFI